MTCWLKIATPQARSGQAAMEMFEAVLCISIHALYFSQKSAWDDHFMSFEFIEKACPFCCLLGQLGCEVMELLLSFSQFFEQAHYSR